VYFYSNLCKTMYKFKYSTYVQEYVVKNTPKNIKTVNYRWFYMYVICHIYVKYNKHLKIIGAQSHITFRGALLAKCNVILWGIMTLANQSSTFNLENNTCSRPFHSSPIYFSLLLFSVYNRPAICNIFLSFDIKIEQIILGVVKRNPLFFHSISCKK